VDPVRVKKTRQNKADPIALNLPVPNRDQKQGPPLHHCLAGKFGDLIFMKSVRPDNTDPIPLRSSPHNMGTIMIRFVGLLVAAVVVLALLWSR
jgi:hypothetical protein